MFPQKGRTQTDVLANVEQMKSLDMNWRSRKYFDYVFYGGDELHELIKKAYESYMDANGLNPTMFAGLRKMEEEVIAMTADLLNGQRQATGNMSSGGTESIMLALLAAREWANKHKPNITHPQVIVPNTAHPAFFKAAHYFGIQIKSIPVQADFRADIAATRQAISSQTIMLVGSAPSYPQGVVDDLVGLAQLAQQHGILCHSDACVGGFILPFAKKLGYDIPPFDFSVPGITSISADLHKYGYSAKGASVILYRDPEIRRGQFFVKTDWAGGIFGSPSLAGTRPGGAIAAAWAVLQHLGMEGYLAKTATAMNEVQILKQGIAQIDGVYILGKPNAATLAIGSDKYDIYAVADEMSLLGWSLNRQQLPPSIHITLTDYHVGMAQVFLDDLQVAIKKSTQINWQNIKKNAQVGAVKRLKQWLPDNLFERLTSSQKNGNTQHESPRKAAMYGMMTQLSGSASLDEMVRAFLDQLNTRQGKKGG